ncbi:MAG: pirin family protein [Gammaproteobacteria bacterium]|nr:pirin family protein [Gammaproteobacteria bacterium]MDH4313675.1 pirin family protein [Gammaproteobacteria bacterium]MDH5214608.1 pirin family protein [Gammaproteobacteria bacterium]MDH5500511.1 pirin family protein [Gammaproteobacteria bacterium]
MKGTGHSVARILTPASRSLGEFDVRRTLPDRNQQRVGPFIFFDHMGPADFSPGSGVNVRPHPHIGLATITYLFAGAIRHRDSLGFDQLIRPGDVNWMTAGRGVVHSERTPESLKRSGSHLHGIQAWIALPTESEEIEPDFVHYAADTIPRIDLSGASLKVIAGNAYGGVSPVRTASETLYVEADLEKDATLQLPEGVDEIGVYVVDGAVDIGGNTLSPGRMAVLAESATASLDASMQSKCMLLGGKRLNGERHIWWNFVSSSRRRIEQAKNDWRDGRFDSVPGDPEFIPLPGSNR